MIIIKLLLCTHLLFLVSNSYSQTDSVYMKEISQLTGNRAKSDYLETIFQSDQDIRVYWNEEVAKDTSYSGRKRILDQVREVDSINLVKVGLYLNHYGYPNQNEIDGLALSTPWLIIHHATHNEVRIKYYPILLEAYHNNNIKEEPFRMYLCRTLSIHTSKDFSSFDKQKISRLIKKMKKVHDRGSSLK